jgi:hypothetical protein
MVANKGGYVREGRNDRKCPKCLFLSGGILRYFTLTGGITSLGVFSDAFPGHKMRVHLLPAPGILVIWVVTHPSNIWPHCCLTSVIKWVPVCQTWQDAVHSSYQATAAGNPAFWIIFFQPASQLVGRSVDRRKRKSKYSSDAANFSDDAVKVKTRSDDDDERIETKLVIHI